jgi:hypothetical protein
MNTYWLPDRGTAEHFWEHEWRKHGTCINTLSPSCYGDEYQQGDEVVDFFTRAVEVFKVCPPILQFPPPRCEIPYLPLRCRDWIRTRRSRARASRRRMTRRTTRPRSRRR